MKTLLLSLYCFSRLIFSGKQSNIQSGKQVINKSSKQTNETTAKKRSPISHRSIHTGHCPPAHSHENGLCALAPNVVHMRLRPLAVDHDHGGSAAGQPVEEGEQLIVDQLGVSAEAR